ncbi:MAG: hypothetical protein HDR09_21740 [Lachnospiraceae bacterium]|nr:hypothetical protein [Lachnospiraceae bacterium]MBD5506300.1 hypothetical protein [Lachnospiraceae bacterium]
MGIKDQIQKKMNTEAVKESAVGAEQTTADQTITDQSAEVKSDSMRQEYAFAADVKLRECKYCRVMIPKKAKICPNCKMVLKKHTGIKVAAVVLAIAAIGGGLSAYMGLLPDHVVPAWMVKNKSSEPVLSVTTVETPETAAGAQIVESVDVAVAADLPKPDAAEAELEEKIAQSVNGMTAGKSETEAVSTEEKDESGTDNAVNGNEKAAKDTENDSEEDGENSKIEVADKETGRSGKETGTTGKSVARNDEESKDTGEAAGRTGEESEATGKTATRNSGETKASGNTADTEEDRDDQDDMFPEDMDVNEAAFRADCVWRDYKELLRNEDYLGTAVWLEAEVICPVEGGLFDESIYYLCMMEESNGIERYYIIRDDRAEEQLLILEGDVLTIYGRLFGNCKLPASLIETRPTVPAISMLSCDLQE